jgi:hypothetical protein
VHPQKGCPPLFWCFFPFFATSGTFCKALIFGTAVYIFGNTNGLGSSQNFLEKPAIVCKWELISDSKLGLII